MMHQRGAWTVEVLSDPEFRGDHFDAGFDRTVRAGRYCERFTLFDDDRPASETAILQILIWSASMIQIQTYAPCLVRCYPRQKVILVGVMRPTSHGGPPPKRTSPRQPAA